MKKRITAFFLALVLLISIIAPICFSAFAVTFDRLNASDVFLKQAGSTTCTLCATTMMMRRYSMLRGDSGWNSITEAAVKPTAWINGTGLRWSFSYSNSSVSTISVGHYTLPGGTENEALIQAELRNCPEGIVIYNESVPHAVLLTDYTDGIYYCADPLGSISSGRIPLTSAYRVRITNVTAYWKVTSPIVPGPEIDHTHSYTSSVTKSPTCTANGVRTYTCSCGSSYTESIAALGHDYSGDRLYEPVHPHPISQRCVRFAVCGGFVWTGENYTISSCAQCVAENPKQIHSSTNSVSLHLNEIKSQTIHFWSSGYYSGDAIWSYGTSNSNISCTWGKWTDDLRLPLTINASFPGDTTLTITLKDKVTEAVIDTLYISVSVDTNTSAISVNSSNSAVISTAGETKYFTYTPTTSGKYVIYSTGSEDTKVYLYNASWTELDNDDDSGDSTNFRLERNLTAGTKYTFAVRYYSTSKTGTIPFKFGKIFTISYNANGGAGAPSSQNKDYGMDVTLSNTVPTRTGYTFLGWSTNSNATNPTYQPGNRFSVNADTTLYAVWERITVTKVTITAEPNKTVYYMGDELDTTGLCLRIDYSDGHSESVTSGYTVSGYYSSSAGKRTVRVFYGERSDTFEVNIIFPVVSLSEESLNISQGAFHTLTAHTEPGGHTVEWVSSDETVATVTNGRVTAVGIGTATISAILQYKEHRIFSTCRVTVTAPTLTDVRVLDSSALKTVYQAGEALDTSGLQLQLTYSDGTVAIVSDGYTVSGFDPSRIGTQSIYIRYQGMESKYSITVNCSHVYTDDRDTDCNICGAVREVSVGTMGDVDGNGTIDSTDARLVLQYTVKKINSTALNLTVADVDGDGKADSTDARLILQYTVKIIQTFPIG